MPKLFSGKITLVAGAGQSMAASVIRRFLEEDATVLVPAKSLQELSRLKAALSDVNTTGLVTMLMDYPDYYKAFETAQLMMERFGKIDIAVFCFDDPAETRTLPETDIIEWEKMIDEQITAYFVGARISLNTMRCQQGGMFISISEIHTHSESYGNALAALALNMQKKMAEMFGKAAKKYHIKWHHISLTHDTGGNVGENTNAPHTPGDCIIALYGGQVSDTTNIFQSFSIPDTASGLAVSQ